LAKSATEIFNEKVGLIFEYDKSSPLFVRHANTEIENNNLDRAIEILTEGIKLYPDYPTAYVLYYKALSLSGEYGKALLQAKTAGDLLHSRRTYDYYLKEIENMKKRSSLFASSRGSAFIPTTNYLEKDEQPSLFQREPDLEEEENFEETDIDERLEELAEEISSARLSDIPDADITQSPVRGESDSGSKIVSETLAKIYAAQGEYREAIQVFEKLIERNPSKKEEYLQKIKELNSRLDS
jgi:tetratricopeptide (TPR) repeat protein